MELPQTYWTKLTMHYRDPHKVWQWVQTLHEQLSMSPLDALRKGKTKKVMTIIDKMVGK